MKITLQSIPIRDLFDGYVDNAEEGVRAYHGLLDVRPPYQREFIYKDAQRDAVVRTVQHGFPLNVMYWAVRDDGKTYEVLDGQQRTLSICQYLSSQFSYQGLYFHNLQKDAQEQFLNYPLMVYFCEGAPSEKLEWFRTINIAGEQLTSQELRNAVYAGPWVTDAKRYFSKTGCAAYKLGNPYLTGNSIRQEYLEKAIRWVTTEPIEEYMGQKQFNPTAVDLWNYFQGVIAWVQALFPKYRKEMKGVDWGTLYRLHHEETFDPATLEKEVARLMMDSDVQKKSGIYSYVLDGDEKHLGIRLFDENTKRECYERQKGICPLCRKHFPIEEMEADHITPWSEGGRTIRENCQMLCRDCNRRKGAE